MGRGLLPGPGWAGSLRHAFSSHPLTEEVVSELNSEVVRQTSQTTLRRSAVQRAEARKRTEAPRQAAGASYAPEERAWISGAPLADDAKAAVGDMPRPSVLSR